eukprot:5523874-Pleurochrysis_carterae.AAC.4
MCTRGCNPPFVMRATIHSCRGRCLQSELPALPLRLRMLDQLSASLLGCFRLIRTNTGRRLDSH